MGQWTFEQKNFRTKQRQIAPNNRYVVCQSSFFIHGGLFFFHGHWGLGVNFL